MWPLRVSLSFPKNMAAGVQENKGGCAWPSYVPASGVVCATATVSVGQVTDGNPRSQRTQMEPLTQRRSVRTYRKVGMCEGRCFVVVFGKKQDLKG